MTLAVPQSKSLSFSAGWRRPRFLGVGDVPEGLVRNKKSEVVKNSDE
jgi:hypothetical protein